MVVNGRTWPVLEVEPRRYRLRFLNGCNSRFLILKLATDRGAQRPASAALPFQQIGSDGGFLAAPVTLDQLLLAPAERADVIVDFTAVARGAYPLLNVGPDEPFGGGEPGTDFPSADADTTGRVLQFRVERILGADTSTPPQFLQLPPVTPLTGGTSRRLALLERESETFPEPAEALLGTITSSGGPGIWTARKWEDDVSENPRVGDVEVWELYNATADAHPIHIHELLFQVVNRQAIVFDDDAQTVEVAPGSTARDPEAWERGWKDTVIAYPGEVTRVRMKFLTAGQYVWHCHIVEHEDNEMMRPYRIGPEQDGQPS
jgi:FtsP/CotA-like multicopper oxidase with cupredoxin domain